MSLELRHLRYFVAVAEELSFTRAARRLHMAQPPLSQTIRGLERLLGTELFQRTTRSVVLTPAGRVLLDEAVRILHEVDQAVSRVQQVGRVEQGSLSVGFRPATSLPLLEPIVRLYRQRYPGVEVDLERVDWADQIDCLLEGRVDATFATLPISHPEIETRVLLSAPRAVALAADHPLAKEASLSIGDLARERVVLPAGAPQDWVAFWTVEGRPADPSVGQGPVVSTADESMAVVLSGEGCCFTIATVATFYGNPRLAIVPILDIPPGEIALAWVRSNSSPVLAGLVEAAVEAATETVENLGPDFGFDVSGPSPVEHEEMSAG